MPRDITKPYTEDELVLMKGIFYGIPSYSSEGEYILSRDVREMVRRMDYPRTEEQINSYELYWNNSFGGKVPLNEWISTWRVIHDLRQLSLNRAAVYDTDGNGFISADEFQELLKCGVVHDPRLKNTTYEDFVKEADTDKDGQVSIEELANWVETRANSAS